MSVRGKRSISHFRVNVAGSCFMVQAVTEKMKAYSERENCSVVNISSISAHQTQPNRLDLSDDEMRVIMMTPGGPTLPARAP